MLSKFVYTDEIWAPIEGYPGYLVSNYGRIRSSTSLRPDIILKPQENNSGYLEVTIYRKGIPKQLKIHQAVVNAFLRKPGSPKYKVVDHSNGNRYDNRLSNLRFSTLEENRKNRKKCKSTCKLIINCRDKDTGEFLGEDTADFFREKYGFEREPLQQACRDGYCFRRKYKVYYVEVKQNDKKYMKLFQHFCKITKSNPEALHVCFLPVKGFPRYLITNFGDIWDTKKNLWLIANQKPSGYWRSRLVLGKAKGKQHYVHILVCKTFTENDNSERIFVNHIDGDPSNPYVDNLEWVTEKENSQHSINTGLTKSCVKVCQFDMFGNFIDIHPTIMRAAEVCGESKSTWYKEAEDIRIKNHYIWIDESVCDVYNEKYFIPEEFEDNSRKRVVPTVEYDYITTPIVMFYGNKLENNPFVMYYDAI